jgi:hypothetical protein
MTKRFNLLAITAVLLLLLAACGGAETAPATTLVGPAIIAEEAAGGEVMVEEMAADVHEGEDMAAESGEADEMPAAEMAEEPHEGEDMETADMDEEAHEGDDVPDDDADMAGDDDNEDSMEAAEATADMATRPAWQSLALVNAASGETFTLGGFEGKTDFVEPMATWCTNCRQQLGNVAQARAAAGDDVVFVALSLETTLDPADLAAYQQSNGFDWTFAVMSEEVLQGLAGEFGRSITSAPSTPHFIIRPDGTFTELSTGIDQPEELLAMLEAAAS